jgi:uncharacterized protein YndB with AHSA1/START domain
MESSGSRREERLEMIKEERTVVIDRPIEEVFAYVTDQTNTPNWQASLVDVQRTTPGPIGVGTKHTFVRNFMGRRMEADNEYVAFEPDRLVTFRTTSGPPLVASYLFEAVPDGTRLTSRVELQGAGLFGLLEPVIGASLRREMKAALPALKALLESPSGTTSPQPTAM